MPLGKACLRLCGAWLCGAVLTGRTSQKSLGCSPPPATGFCVEPAAVTWHDRIQFSFSGANSFSNRQNWDRVVLLADGVPSPSFRLLWVDTRRGVAMYELDPPPLGSPLSRLTLAFLRPDSLTRLIHVSFLWPDNLGATPSVNLAIVAADPLRFWLAVSIIAGSGAFLLWAASATNLFRNVRNHLSRFSLAESQAIFSTRVAISCLL
jgi:hypothetical protein